MAAKPEQIFEGGKLQDIFDVLQVPQFAITGALSKDFTIGEAVKQKISPSKALKIENPWVALAVDVIADPLNFLGIGAFTKAGTGAIKAGEAAVTLGKAAQLGQKALVTLDVPFVKALQGVPIVKGTPVFEALTKLGNVIEQVPGFAKLKGTFTKGGTIPKLASIDEIEKVKKGIQQVFQKSDEARALQSIIQSDTLNLSRHLDSGFKTLLKEGRLRETTLWRFLES